MTPPALRLVDTATGEVHGECPGCAGRDDVIGGLERDIRGWAARYAQLKREKDQAAREHEDWPVIKALFDVWRRQTGHTRSRFDEDSFWLALPFYSKHGWELCERAIAGARFDPWVSRRKNGTAKRHDDWALIFRDRAKFEEFANKAPRGWVPTATQPKIEPSSVGAAQCDLPAPGTNGIPVEAVDA